LKIKAIWKLIRSNLNKDETFRSMWINHLLNVSEFRGGRLGNLRIDLRRDCVRVLHDEKMCQIGELKNGNAERGSGGGRDRLWPERLAPCEEDNRRSDVMEQRNNHRARPVCKILTLHDGRRDELDAVPVGAWSERADDETTQDGVTDVAVHGL